MPFANKTLWIEFMNNDNLARVKSDIAATGVNGICVRTEATILPGLMHTFKNDMGLKVYGWMYPRVVKKTDHPDPTKPAKGYYAAHEADYVAHTLIPAGLDGYIMDIESHNDDGPKDADWDRNDIDLTPLAQYYTTTIKNAAVQSGRPFLIGFTSHANAFNIYQGTPWAPFLAITDVMFPQTYWRRLTSGGCVEQNIDPHTGKGSPEHALKIGDADYRQWNKPIIPIAGEIRCSTADEIKRFGALMAARGVTEGHFYVSYDGIKPDVLAEIKNS